MKYFFIIIITLSFSTLLSCKKDFLEKRPDKALTVPSTLADFRALLDNAGSVMNFDIGITTIGSDDFYLAEEGLQGLNTATEQNAYIWAQDIYQGRQLTDWTRMYQQIFYCNVVLEGLDKINENQKQEVNWKQLKGAAMFYRAMAFYNLSQAFAPTFDPRTADTDLGIPLRISSEVTLPITRGTVAQTYLFVIKELEQAKELLPEKEVILTRPIRNAALALLARVHLQMGDYINAEKYADASLLENNKLIDYNTLSTTAARSFPIFFPDNKNEEVIYYSKMINYSFFSNSLTFVDPLLYQSYQDNDLRKFVFFADKGSGRFSFKGSYTGSSALFSGLTTREVYLIKAECAARNNRDQQANAIINSLLVKRYKTANFTPTSLTGDQMLTYILSERRKELIGSGLRWSDLRRLNLDSRYALTLSKTVNQSSYTLLPNSKRYVYAIPDLEVQLSGIEQNVR